MLELTGNFLPEMNSKESIGHVLEYASSKISGKINTTSKSGKSSRQYKVGSRDSIRTAFYEIKGDNPLSINTKIILRHMLEYFFHSADYEDWIEKNSKIKDSKKKEFLKTNAFRFEQIFLDPTSGRMHFLEGN